MTKVRSALRKSPYRNLLPLIVRLNVEKSGCFMIAAINGVIRSFTKELTTAVKAAPIMTPTARSTTFPRSIKFLNPLIIFLYYLIAQLLAHFLDILLYFFDVLLYFVDVLGLLVDSHLYEYRQIYRLERNNRSEYEQHAVHVDKPSPRRAETYRKQKCMHAYGLRRAYPARGGAGSFFNIYFHGVPTENRTLVTGTTSSSVNRYTIGTILCTVFIPHKNTKIPCKKKKKSRRCTGTSD